MEMRKLNLNAYINNLIINNFFFKLISDGKLNEIKDDNQFLPSQHQNNFTVYIQILISQVLDPHFISEIIEDNGK